MTAIGANAFCDIEGGLKAWLETHPVLAPLVGGIVSGDTYRSARVFLGMPSPGPGAWPVFSIYRIGGGPMNADVPVDVPRVQIDVWGDIGKKVACFNVTKTLVSTLLDLPCGTLLSSEVRVLGVSNVTVPYVPDRDNGRPRYSVNAVIQAQAV